MLRPRSFVLVSCLVLLAAPVSAQDAPEDGAAEGVDAAAEPAPPPPAAAEPEASPPIAPSAAASASEDDPQLLGDEQALYEEEVGTEEQYSGAHPHEEEGKSYFFLGAFYRHQFVPSGLLELFLDAAPSENMPQFGGEFIRRRDGMDVIASVYYADYRFSGPFLAKDDPPQDVEWIDSDMWAVMGSVTLLWGSHFSDWFAIQYGLGVGVGWLFGDMVRTEAYPSNSGHSRCVAPTGPGLPGSAQSSDPNDPAAFSGGLGETVEQYCAPPSSFPTDADGDDGEHYGVTARTWFDSGSRPNLWFRFAPQLSLRFKPMHQLVIRVDGGFDLFSGIFVGAAAAFGF